ncbi:MAG: metal-dependent hydrolase [Kofleriaceae bacterium]
MAIPIPRDPGIDVTDVPRHWAGASPVATAISNGINLLFPHGERFFVRSVHHFLAELSDPTLVAQVKAFSKQEGHHARAHDELNAVLRTQGFEIDRFLDRYKQITSWLERRTPAKLNLAGTAAAEHFTAILAAGAFDKGILDQLHPTMQKLLAWHAAEEIEHKAVAFDVLHEVDPSYALRVAGLAHATILLSSFWLWGAVMLLRQEQLGWRGLRRELRAMRRGERARGDGPVITRVFLRGIRQYLRRDFHPSDNANEHLARAWFAAHDMAFTEAA